MKHRNPRVQLRQDLQRGAVAVQPRTEDEKNAARAAQIAEAITAALSDADWAVRAVEHDDRTLTFTFEQTEKGLRHVDAISTRVGDPGLGHWIMHLKRKLRELELEHADERD